LDLLQRWSALFAFSFVHRGYRSGYLRVAERFSAYLRIDAEFPRQTTGTLTRRFVGEGHKKPFST